jgi:hypothetical protein
MTSSQSKNDSKIVERSTGMFMTADGGLSHTAEAMPRAVADRVAARLNASIKKYAPRSPARYEVEPT